MSQFQKFLSSLTLGAPVSIDGLTVYPLFRPSPPLLTKRDITGHRNFLTQTFAAVCPLAKRRPVRRVKRGTV